jgi:hypothetical protein
MKENRLAVLMVLLSVVFTTSVFAGNGTGAVGQMVIGRMGEQVYVELVNPTLNSFPCATQHFRFQYAFLTSKPGGKEMLSALLAAKATGQPVLIVGSATCTIDPQMEDVSYVWLL